MFRGYVTLLLVGGLTAAITGTLLPLGGGTTLAMLGAASFGAALVLIGTSLRHDRVGAPDRSPENSNLGH